MESTRAPRSSPDPHAPHAQPAVDLRTIAVLSDIHYASPAEKARGSVELKAISNPLLRGLVKNYRHFIWRRDPFAHNHLLTRFAESACDADFIVANGDYSCDTAFIGVSDDAAFESARLCLAELRARFGPNLRATLGDHELGKMSLFGGQGGLRLASWRRAQEGLNLEPFWVQAIGRCLLMGITSSVVALPVFESEALPDERAEWQEIRRKHMDCIRGAFASLSPDQRVLLFCHDPTALPFLWEDPVIRSKLNQLDATVIGHLHSRLFLWNSRVLSGMPTITFLGNSIRRMSAALRRARHWRPFRIQLCPALAGIELLKDGGYLRIGLDPTAEKPAEIHRFQL